jgi:hypothetical protein
MGIIPMEKLANLINYMQNLKHYITFAATLARHSIHEAKMGADHG